MKLPSLKAGRKIISGNPIDDILRFFTWVFGKAKNAPKSKLGKKIRRELHR